MTPGIENNPDQFSILLPEITSIDAEKGNTNDIVPGIVSNLKGAANGVYSLAVPIVRFAIMGCVVGGVNIAAKYSISSSVRSACTPPPATSIETDKLREVSEHIGSTFGFYAGLVTGMGVSYAALSSFRTYFLGARSTMYLWPATVLGSAVIGSIIGQIYAVQVEKSLMGNL